MYLNQTKKRELIDLLKEINIDMDFESTCIRVDRKEPLGDEIFNICNNKCNYKVKQNGFYYFYFRNRL